MTRLSSLHRPKGARFPSYDRGAVRTGIVHLGVGAFHRAHQAVFTEACLEAGDLRWGILGASLRSTKIAEQLNPQDGLYTCLVRDGGTKTASVIGAVRRVCFAPKDPAALVANMARRDVHIVTLTVTEKAYGLDPATGSLLREDPDIATDISDLAQPRTSLGYLVAALAARRAKGLAPFTTISCDNLQDNGRKLRKGVLTFAQAVDPALGDWIEEHAAFPSTMVDRIVPAIVPEDMDAFEAEYGVRDLGLVKTEPFRQWVIEDDFCGPRPEWERAGVQFTKDVGPWEMAKLRLLNGAHSALAYLGGLAGHAHVHSAMADPVFEAFVTQLHNEAASTLEAPAGLNIERYRHDLVARFKNRALLHKTHQIAMDGSQKLPQRLLGTIAVRLARGERIDALALGVAGWMRWQMGVDDAGQAFPVDDPLAHQTKALLLPPANGHELAARLCGLEAVFGKDLPRNPHFVETVGGALEGLLKRGARATLLQVLKESQTT